MTIRELMLGIALVTSSIQGTQTVKPIPVAVARIAQDIYGPGFEIFDGHFLLGDFNGDGMSDVAVELYGDAARKELAGRGVRVLSTSPFDAEGNGKLVVDVGGMNCLGLGIILGYQRPVSEIPKGDRFYTYDCYSATEMVLRGSKVAAPDARLKWKESPPALKGDALLLDEENGGSRLIYWAGETFRGYPQRWGD
jgi:hypothetical protein